MEQCLRIFLFGDQTFDLTKKLHALLRAENDPILASFFAGSYRAIQSELSKLPFSQQLRFGNTSSLSSLVTLTSQGSCNPSLDHFLATVYQLGIFIQRCTQLGGSYPQSSSSYIVGMCIGSLAAAAVGSCQTLSELLPVAIETSVVSFRAGLLAEDVKTRVHPKETTQNSWSMMCPGLSVQHAAELIAAFSKDQDLPLASRPYLSSWSSRGTTISGPPSSLCTFQNIEELKHRDIVWLPIYAPYHAPHLYSPRDLDLLIDSAVSLELTSSNLPILSCATGKLIWASNFQHLARNALSEIFLKPVMWDLMIDGLQAAVQASQIEDILLTPIATEAGSALQAALKRKTSVEIHVSGDTELSTDAATSRNGSDPRKSKIAIIGAAGRFPCASDMTAFWEILYSGLDVHDVVPPLRWDPKTHVDVSGVRKNTSATPFGCWLENPGMFDAKFFGISPKEAPQMDPAQRLALLTAYEAIEQAGLVPDGSLSTRRSRVGVFYGVTSLREQNI